MKRNLWKYPVVILSLSIATCSAAFGLAFHQGKVPEIDPSLAIGGLTLLAGSIAVLRTRQKK